MNSRFEEDAAIGAWSSYRKLTLKSELQDLSFPAKRLFGSRKDHVVKERAVELHRFLIKLLFLTHTYRKAQKARYDQYVQALPAHQQAAYAALQDRTQASVTVFYLLRDFLKPVTIKTDVSLQSGDLLGNAGRGSGLDGDAGDESDNSPKRLIRESKILAMRTSNASAERKKKHSGRSLLKEAEKMMQQERRKELQREQLRKEQQKYQQQQMPVAVPVNDARSKHGAVLIEDPVKDELDAAAQNNNQNSHKTAKMTDLMAASERSRAEANSLREQLKQKQHSAPSLSDPHRNYRHYSTPNEDGAEWKGRAARAVTAASTLGTVTSSSMGSEPDKTIAPSSVPSSASSSTSVDDVKLVDLSSVAKDKSKKTSRRGSLSSEKSSHKPRSKTRSKRKAKSAMNLQSDTERMSRVNSQLNVQTISIHAQRELEKYLSEYSAIMILRYVDRFINKAVMKAPGCYRVNAQHKLVIDGQRFLEELELVFTDLPSNFGEMFHTGTPGDHDEWSLPKAMDKYVQMKWNSFQGMAMSSSSIVSDNGNDHSSYVDHTSDSDDDSETEYEYEEVGGGGFMSSKQDFSNDEESMLQEMIANGTAGREQMLRLRRQNNERGWNRRENPGSRSRRVIEEASSSESEEETTIRQKRRSNRREPKRSVSCVVEKYQQEQNARRKDRLSRVQSIGGFV
ncbi:hypothetical protein JM18_003590 [Phytophthora kernoviae]|uniref:PX domain-containing protein n=2 Tax=Phytophthora kernoviae TaxID=325452 RepID=A0A8T0LTS6_9STRA|nr:hypothetical protein G195_004894 [Phytophthora kernoviae 00238/432]KAG2521600.1 hypothetical protein JM16_004216 [Phytophthora kernoviae]KAG2523032.1 hypothetical protein JM18_003590 [Phytophthora kernoviae]